MFLARDSPWYSFWKNLETGYQWFEQKKIPPNATVQDKKYHFGD
jgi:murein L,D-transpeptidase YafK